MEPAPPPARFDRLGLWRFLLPAVAGPDRTVAAVGAAEPAAAQLVQSGLATALDPPGSRAPAAFVVCAPQHPGDVARALDRLAPGGALVVAVTRSDARRLGCRPADLEWLAAAHGAHRVSRWLAAPDGGSARRYVSLDDPAALRWYLRSVFEPATPSLFLVRVVGGLLARPAGLRALARWASSTVVVLSRSSTGAEGPAALAVHPGPLPAESWLLVSSAQDAASRAVLLPFTSGAAAPSAAFKLSPGPGFNEQTAGEHHRLEELRRTVEDATVRSGLPVPLAIGQIGACTVAAQSPAAGTSLSRATTVLGRRRHRSGRQLETVAAWTTRFNQAATSSSISWSAASAQTHLGGAVAELLPAGDALGDRIRQRMDEWTTAAAGMPVPLVEQHFDLTPSNVFIGAGDEITVLDWEVSEERTATRVGLPRDLLFLTTYWLFQAERARDRDDEVRLVEALVGTTPDRRRSVATARGVVQRWQRSLGMTEAILPLLHVALWVDRAAHHRRRAEATGADPHAPDGQSTASLRYLQAIVDTP